MIRHNPAPSKRAVKGAGDKLDDPTLHMLESAIPLEPEKPFTIYEDIRQKLIAGGMRPTSTSSSMRSLIRGSPAHRALISA